MPISDYLRREPERGPVDEIGPVVQTLVILAFIALIVGFFLGHIIQSQFAGVSARNQMLSQAVDQFDEAVTSADNLAASAQQNILAVFGANGVSPELPKLPEKKAEGDQDKADGSTDVPQPAPAPLPSPFPPKPELKGVDQLRAANDDVARIRDTINVEVEVPDDAPANFSFFGEANAKRNTHKVPVPAPKPAQGSISLSTAILVGFVIFLGAVTVYSLHMLVYAPNAAVRKFYERLSLMLVTFFVLATVGMFGTYLGVKIVLPTAAGG
ncbi:hypothetical protein [Mesorhizobium sp. LSJC264A00]|uniref:hypothetical protein n=1 Tax=unclassified Mesorhizobium TaxID=325217 RepID=UPI0003CED3CF|nr:hypothetical protein [Mesorhizobium sp. LSJC264A00]ESX24151.1 hypothetical protein X767_13050 [Mesorhizobium sp. LSJC264A00]